MSHIRYKGPENELLNHETLQKSLTYSANYGLYMKNVSYNEILCWSIFDTASAAVSH
jgi:hypothetical protein